MDPVLRLAADLVRNYYQLLTSNKYAELQNFYSPNAHLSRASAGAVIARASTDLAAELAAAHAELKQAHILSVDAHQLVSTEIVITVVVASNSLTYVQTLVLESEIDEDQQAAWFIAVDMRRELSNIAPVVEKKAVAAPAVEKKTSTSAPAAAPAAEKPAAPVEKAAPAAEKPAPVVAEASTEKPAAKPEKRAKPAKEHQDKPHPKKQAQQPAKTEPPKPTTWASIASKTPAATESKEATSSAPQAAAPKPVHHVTATATTPESSASTPSDDFAVFVRTDASVSIEAIKAKFNEFATVTSTDPKGDGKAVVHFEIPPSEHIAFFQKLQGAGITINGNAVQIAENHKRPSGPRPSHPRNQSTHGPRKERRAPTTKQ